MGVISSLIPVVMESLCFCSIGMYLVSSISRAYLQTISMSCPDPEVVLLGFRKVRERKAVMLVIGLT